MVDLERHSWLGARVHIHVNLFLPRPRWRRDQVLLTDLLHVCHYVIPSNLLLIVVFHQFLSLIILGQFNVQLHLLRLEMNIFNLVDVYDVWNRVLDLLVRLP